MDFYDGNQEPKRKTNWKIIISVIVIVLITLILKQVVFQ